MNRTRERDLLDDFDTRVAALMGSFDVQATDGRVANRLRNREKVIDALVELVIEGRLGTVDEIVERSGVARRSIFRHFTDLSDLMLAAFRRVLTQALPLAMIEHRGVGTFDERLDVYVEARLRGLKFTQPFGFAVRLRSVDNSAVRSGLAATREILRDQIARHFAAELDGLSPDVARRRIDAVYVIASFEGYDVLVEQLGRPIDDVRAQWTETIRSVLTGRVD